MEYLPRHHPAHEMRNPVFPLIKALYGHPDAGGFWEKHCEKQLLAEGWTKILEIHGVGYRGEVKGKEVHMALGYSHPVVYAIPEGVEIEIDKPITLPAHSITVLQSKA